MNILIILKSLTLMPKIYYSSNFLKDLFSTLHQMLTSISYRQIFLPGLNQLQWPEELGLLVPQQLCNTGQMMQSGSHKDHLLQPVKSFPQHKFCRCDQPQGHAPCNGICPPSSNSVGLLSLACHSQQHCIQNWDRSFNQSKLGQII